MAFSTNLPPVPLPDPEPTGTVTVRVPALYVIVLPPVKSMTDIAPVVILDPSSLISIASKPSAVAIPTTLIPPPRTLIPDLAVMIPIASTFVTSS